jgi:streptogramin lyase
MKGLGGSDRTGNRGAQGDRMRRSGVLVRGTLIRVFVLAMAMAWVGSVAASTTTEKCMGAKLKALAKKEAGLLTCEAKVAATGDSAGLGACQQKVMLKFTTAFGKAGSCAGDQTQCESDAESCDSAMAALLTDTFPSKCEAAKRKAAGKLAGKELVCWAKAAATGQSVQTACITTAEGKFVTGVMKAGGCPDGGSPQAAIENECVYAVVDRSRPLGGIVAGLCGSSRACAGGTFLTTWGSSGTGNGQFAAPGGPGGIKVDGSGNVFAADIFNNRIQKFDNAGTFLTTWGSSGTGNGQFDDPFDIAVDSAGDVFVADTFNNRIQKFDNTGTFLTTWGSPGTGNGQFAAPGGIAVDGSGNVFVADTENNRIQKFDNAGTFLTTWRTGTEQFVGPDSIAVDGSGNVFAAEIFTNRIEKFDNAGTFLTTWGSSGTGNGQFSAPEGVAVDGSGNVFVADTGNNRIQKFDNAGTFLTTWGSFGTGNGQFAAPQGVAVDGSGNVFVADFGNNRIQKFACP